MDRTLIAWNVPNFITIGLMAAIAFLAFAVMAQLVRKWAGNSSAGSNSQSGGY